MALDVGAELLSFGKHLVEIVLPQHRTQGRLRQHVGGGKVLLHLDDGAFGIDDVEIEHRIDFHRDVVTRDHVLGRYLDDLDAQVHAHHFLDEGDQQHKAGPLDLLKAAKREDHGALVFPQYPDADRDQIDSDDQDKGDDIQN